MPKIKAGSLYKIKTEGEDRWFGPLRVQTVTEKAIRASSVPGRDDDDLFFVVEDGKARWPDGREVRFRRVSGGARRIQCN